MSAKTLNWKAILFWGALAGALILAYIFRNDLTAWIQGATSSLNFPTNDLVGQVTGYLQENPLAAVTGLLTVGTAGMALYERYGKINAEKREFELERLKIQGELVADSKIGEANALVNGYKTQISGLQDQLNDTTAQKTIVDLQTKLGLAEEKAKRIQGDLNYIEKIKEPVTPEQFIQLIKESKKIGQ